MSSKDLQGLRLLKDFIDAGIDSLKIEGRMKSHLYAGTMSKVYSEALRYYEEHGDFLSDDLITWEKELSKVSHRAYTEASLETPAGADSIFNERENDSSAEWKMVGTVLKSSPESGIVIEVRNAFNQGDELEILPFRGAPVTVIAHEIMDLTRKQLQRTKPTTIVRLPYHAGINFSQLVRLRSV
jgi:putative protease